jgi:hypothetical protein
MVRCVRWEAVQQEKDLVPAWEKRLKI